MILGRDCEVCSLNTHEARSMEKHGRVKTLAPIKLWFVGRVYVMHREFGDCWVEYRDPTDLMDHSSNMQIGLCWYQKETQQVMNLRSYGSFDGRFRDKIAIVSLTYIVDLDAYELHPRDEKKSLINL